MADHGGPGLLLSITVDGVEVVHRKFRALEGMVQDLSKAWEQVGAELRSDFAINMLTEGGRYAPWPELADSTIKEKARKYPGAPMEWRTGMLADSLADEGAPGNITEIHAMSAIFGTRIPYAGFQHFGTSRGLPARKLVGVSRYAEEKIVAAMGDYIRNSIRESGLS